MERTMPANRRQFLSRFAPAAVAASFCSPAFAQIQMSRPTAYAFSFTGLDGKPIRLAEHAGKPILVVNTASQCGYTPQYTGLQELWTRYRERGLLIVAVPSNDFGGQEPGGSAEIMKTAQDQYGVSFPLAAKAEVRGPATHPFYKWAALERPGETPRWNFHKYLVGRDGHITAVFSTQTEPMDARVIAAIERELRAR
jgi:glutathione peroxidase